MTLLEQLHVQRKARLQRIADAGIRDKQCGQAASAPQIFEPPPKPKDASSTKRDWLLVSDEERDFERHPVLISEIQRLVANYFHVTRADLLCQRRTASITLPRQIAMSLCKTFTLSSLPEIGRYFGGRDHTTVLHAIRKIERMRADDKDFDALIKNLEGEIENVGQKFR